MGIKESVFHNVAGLLIERPAAGKTYDELAAKLEQAGAELERKAAAAKNTAGAQATMRHITGIERWSQSRLRVLLGEPFVRDEYDGYQPGATLDLAGQIAAFQETRAETVEIARQLQAAKVEPSAKVEHNDFGPISARGWLSYITTHANIESKKFR